MSTRIKIAEAAQVTPGQRKLIKLKGKEIALFNIEGTFYAIDNSCPHSTGPLIEGRLVKNIVTCPWHGSQFDITNGQCYSGPATRNVTSYPLHVEGNAVFIELT
jgi:nitrite reductase (NADH) small subunit/3-phenylpropionate/trans-cinnamate dioxygenase ferredoxin subunit